MNSPEKCRYCGEDHQFDPRTCPTALLDMRLAENQDAIDAARAEWDEQTDPRGHQP